MPNDYNIKTEVVGNKYKINNDIMKWRFYI